MERNSEKREKSSEKRFEKIIDSSLVRVFFKRANLELQRRNYEMVIECLLSILYFNPKNTEAKKFLMEIIKTKKPKLAPKTKAKVDRILKNFDKELEISKKREKAKKIAFNFIKENYPKLESLFSQSWEAIIKIPKGMTLAITKKEYAALGLEKPEQKTSVALLYQILFVILNVLDEIDESTDKKEIKVKVQEFAKQNKLKKKIRNQLIEALILKFDKK